MYRPFAFALQFDTVRHLQREQISQMISERTDLSQGMFFDAKVFDAIWCRSFAIKSILTFYVRVWHFIRYKITILYPRQIQYLYSFLIPVISRRNVGDLRINNEDCPEVLVWYRCSNLCKNFERYSTLFTHDRPAVTDTLRKFVDEEEMIRRIIYIATTEGTIPILPCFPANFCHKIFSHWYFEQQLNKTKLFMLPR